MNSIFINSNKIRVKKIKTYKFYWGRAEFIFIHNKKIIINNYFNRIYKLILGKYNEEKIIFLRIIINNNYYNLDNIIHILMNHYPLIDV